MVNGLLTGINSIQVNLDARSIKSEKGATMDKNMCKALQTEKYPSITFIGTKVTPVLSSSFNAEGKLTIAGTTKTVNLTVARKKNSNGDWVFTGTKALKMTDFNVEPPVLLLGTLKTADDITITFEAIFSVTSELSSNQN
jgi:polyisoprenoid-binding protein YceI